MWGALVKWAAGFRDGHPCGRDHANVQSASIALLEMDNCVAGIVLYLVLTQPHREKDWQPGLPAILFAAIGAYVISGVIAAVFLDHPANKRLKEFSHRRITFLIVHSNGKEMAIGDPGVTKEILTIMASAGSIRGNLAIRLRRSRYSFPNRCTDIPLVTIPASKWKVNVSPSKRHASSVLSWSH